MLKITYRNKQNNIFISKQIMNISFRYFHTVYYIQFGNTIFLMQFIRKARLILTLYYIQTLKSEYKTLIMNVQNARYITLEKLYSTLAFVGREFDQGITTKFNKESHEGHL